MKIYILFTLLFLLQSCMNSPDISTHKETIAQNKIQDNKISAKEAQQAYLKLQEQRNNH